MINAKKTTLDEYIELADDIDELLQKYSDLHIKSSELLGKRRSKSDIFFRIQDLLFKIKSEWEDDMFRSIPGLNDTYLNVFYGSPEEKEKYRDIWRKVYIG